MFLTSFASGSGAPKKNVEFSVSRNKWLTANRMMLPARFVISIRNESKKLKISVKRLTDVA